jgi:hypothetical protein
MSSDIATHPSRRAGSTPSIRILVLVVVLSALTLAGTLAGLAAAVTLATASGFHGPLGRLHVRVAPVSGVSARLAGAGARIASVVAVATASAPRMSSPVHGQSLDACAARPALHSLRIRMPVANVWLPDGKT